MELPEPARVAGCGIRPTGREARPRRTRRLAAASASALLLLVLAAASMPTAEPLPTLGFGRITFLDKISAWSDRLNVTLAADLPCAQLGPQPLPPRAAAAPAATPPPCGPLLGRPEWLTPGPGGNDMRSAALFMALSRDAYPKEWNLTGDANLAAFRCATAAKLRALGAANVTFIDGALVNALLARAGRRVFLVFRGTDGAAQTDNNGLWASDGTRLWWRQVRVHGGFLLTLEHAGPLLARLLMEAIAEGAAEAAAKARGGGGAEAAAAAAGAGGGNGIGGDGGKAEIYLAGHSRGGALAELFAAMLSSSYPASLGGSVVAVHTFGAPKIGNKKFTDLYSYYLGERTHAWWNEKDIIPFLPPQAWLGFHHLGPKSRWRIWGGACQRARCSVADALAGRPCMASDCPFVTERCEFNEKQDHPPPAYVAKIKACVPPSAAEEACLAWL